MIMCLLLVILYAILTVEGGRCVLMILLQMERGSSRLHSLLSVCGDTYFES